MSAYDPSPDSRSGDDTAGTLNSLPGSFGSCVVDDRSPELREPGTPAIEAGTSLWGEGGLPVQDDVDAMDLDSDVVLEFISPEDATRVGDSETLEDAEICAQDSTTSQGDATSPKYTEWTERESQHALRDDHSHTHTPDGGHLVSNENNRHCGLMFTSYLRSQDDGIVIKEMPRGRSAVDIDVNLKGQLASEAEQSSYGLALDASSCEVSTYGPTVLHVDLRNTFGFQDGSEYDHEVVHQSVEEAVVGDFRL